MAYWTRLNRQIGIIIFLFFASMFSGCQINNSQIMDKSLDLHSNIGMKGNMMQTVEDKMGFKGPTAICFDRKGSMYVANWSGGTVSKVDNEGKTTTFAEIAGSPAGLACDEQGNIYVSDYRENIYRVSSEGGTTIFATGLHTPTGICFNKNGDLLVTNRSSNELIKISKEGDASIIARGLRTPVGVVEHSDGTIYISNYGGGITQLYPDGSVTTISTEFVTPGCGIVVFQGEVLVVDNGQGTIKSLGLDGRQLKIVAQNLKQPVALGVNPKGRLYVGTWGDGSVHLLDKVTVH